jgi:hypothetical protein
LESSNRYFSKNRFFPQPPVRIDACRYCQFQQYYRTLLYKKEDETSKYYSYEYVYRPCHPNAADPTLLLHLSQPSSFIRHSSLFRYCASMSTVVDTEEENRSLRQQDQIRHARDQLRQIPDSAPIVVPAPDLATNGDVENGNHVGLPRSDKPKCGTRGS